jgi:transposase
MFMDEARFGRINDVRRCWAPPGIRPIVPFQIVRKYTYAYAAICPFDGDLDALILPEVNTQSMSLFLTELSQNHEHEHIVLILDRAGWHTAKDLNIPENITLHWLPPYSPELNPVEHLWDEIREKWFLNRYFSSLDAVEDQLMEALKTLMKDCVRVKSISLFNWMVDC